MVFCQVELARGAQHALALHTAQFPQLDRKGLAVLRWRQLCPDKRAGYTNPNPRVGRTTNDVQQLRLSNINLANAQTVRVGMLLRLRDLAYYNTREGWRKRS
jgi:hypothetical protein